MMAPVFLDGEIWFGRGCYLDSQRLLQQFDLDALWQFFRFVKREAEMKVNYF